ncbi:helix-turn-helix transcriptional regulator [Streptosporangium sp. NPDC048865]|uniref:helix-turn-helix domain-containing protein n=1 Tax=Streptosporangium sp. NPDC048865 TaxID=3155766 RepID=UPI0034180B35
METMPTRRRPLIQDPKAVRRLRLRKALEQAELAELAGISISHMSKIETGAGSPGAKVLGKLATALGCEVEELMAQ